MKSKRFILKNEGKYVRWIHHVADYHPNSFSYAENDDQIFIVSEDYLEFKPNNKNTRKELLLEKFPNLILEEVYIASININEIEEELKDLNDTRVRISQEIGITPKYSLTKYHRFCEKLMSYWK